MAFDIFNRKVDPQCVYCEHGSVGADKAFVLCRKKGGVMQPFSHCRKFKYDPLKRVPKSVSMHTDFSKEDFSL